MNKIITSLIITILCLVKQYTYAQNMSIGVRGGLNLASMSYSYTNFSTSSKGVSGLQLGLFAQQYLNDKWILQPSLNFGKKGVELSVLGLANPITNSVTINYLELPVNFMYQASEQLLIGAGPYIAYGLSGTTKISQNGISQEKDLVFGSGETNRFDAGLNIAASFEFTPNWFLSANYSFGLTNVSDDANESVHNRVLGISIATLIKK